jgi:hypothetical protein
MPDLPKLPAPARRALAQAGYTDLAQLEQVREGDLAELHGMGEKALDSLRKAMAEHDLSFRS